MPFTSFRDIHTVANLYMSNSGTRYRHGLEHMYVLLEHLGNPQDKLRVVHVAGTSGKTSTAYYTAALLRAAGKHVGLTVSPHVDEVNERVQIDLAPMPEAAFAVRFGEYLELVRSSGVTPNYFELFLAFALWEFAARNVDYAVVEVGIGGLLDSTNVLTREDKVCIITDIGLDHMDVLGNTLPEIAVQKAGIIQLHNAAFCYKQGSDVHDAIRRQAATKQADLHILTAPPKSARFPFLPLFQQRNFGLARSAFGYLAERDQLPPLDAADIERAARTYIPARMEVYKIHDKLLIIDAAHNEQKFQGLLGSIHARYGKCPVAVLGAWSNRARMTGSMDKLVTGVQHCIVTSLPESSANPAPGFNAEAMRTSSQGPGDTSFEVEVIEDPRKAFVALLKRPEPIAVVAGSFMLLNHIRPLLRQVGATTAADVLE